MGTRSATDAKATALTQQPRSRLRALFALAIGIGLLLTGCAAGGEAGSSSDNAALPIDQILTGEFATIDGPILDLETVQNKDVVFWFWAPW